MVFTWSLNLLILPVLCTTYSKRSRAEALYALRDQRPIVGFVIDDIEDESPPMPPLFYMGQWDMEVIPWGTAHSADNLADHLDSMRIQRRPDIALFIGEEDLDARIDRMERDYGTVQVIGREEPGSIDRLVHWLNPVNRNETIVIARLHPYR